VTPADATLAAVSARAWRSVSSGPSTTRTSPGASTGHASSGIGRTGTSPRCWRCPPRAASR
jgi:hypothetical protein